MHAIAGAVLLGISLTASNAWALALGRASVQSGLGEPLRAEIDLPAITSDESASLQVNVADGDAFRAAGMDFNPLLTDVRFTVERRADGRTVLRLTSTRPVSEPFLDMVLQARWAGGQLERGYTMLFDPPNLRTPAAPAPLLPSGSAAARAPGSATATPAASAEAQPSELRRPSHQPPTTRPRSAERPAAPAPANEGAAVKVQPGDTAGRIAQANKPAEVSLDQMLVAMLRANPNAFISNNVNRLKAGAVLDMPTQANAAGVDAQEAHRIIVGQSRDFQAFRRRMAEAAPAKAPAPQARAASGQVQAEVTEKAAPAPADKLTLSKGTASAKGGTEDKIAQQRQQEATSNRSGELSRNLEELNKLQQAASANASAPAASGPAPAAATLATSATATAAPMPAQPAAEAPTAPPPAPAPAVKPPPPPPAAPKPTPAPSFIDSLTGSLSSNPMTLPAAGGVAVLLGGLLWWRRRSAAKSATAAAFDDSLVQAGAADASGGGQSVDTSEHAGPVSSMMYSPSQLDAAGDVDPIAEADVYLAYGRDQQAEEILREALRLHPDRLPLRAKLLEVLAQRADKTGFEREATELLAQTSGVGAEWDAARTMGQQLDPGNPLYRGGSEHAAEALAADVPLDLDLGALSPQASPEPPAPEPDMVMKMEAPVAEIAAEMPPIEAAPEAPAAEPPPTSATENDHHLDFDLDLVSDLAAQAPALEPTPAPEVSSPEGLDFDIELEHESHPAPVPAEAASTLPTDIQDLTLDLPSEPAPTGGPDLGDLSQIEVTEGVATDNPLETKLSLAHEFEAIGDVEGARSLAEEVEAEARGDLQARARAFLAQLA